MELLFYYLNKNSHYFGIFYYGLFMFLHFKRSWDLYVVFPLLFNLIMY